ncbi:ubiquitin-NEDD8-like protein RUB1 [Capsella rubella]|nr:ubiquitin-NEDD8-like protein RUB1 [Capsella rubella]
MEILVKTVKGKTINLEVDDSSETIDIKIYGEPISQVVMHLAPGSAPVQCAAIKIFVSTLKGKTFNLEVKGSETIKQVKNMIHDQGGPPVGKQTLLLQGVRLADSRTIAHYNIKTGANLVVMSELCGC